MCQVRRESVYGELYGGNISRENVLLWGELLSWLLSGDLYVVDVTMIRCPLSLVSYGRLSSSSMTQSYESDKLTRHIIL